MACCKLRYIAQVRVKHWLADDIRDAIDADAQLAAIIRSP